MNRRCIPHTEMEVSVLCLGTMTFGTPVGEADATRIVRRAMGLGINFIDTANIYEGYARVLSATTCEMRFGERKVVFKLELLSKNKKIAAAFSIYNVKWIVSRYLF